MYVFHHTYLLEDCSLCLLYHLDCCFVVGFQPHVRLTIGLTVWLRLWNLSHIFRLVSLIISFTWSHKHYTYCGELNDSGFTMYFWLIAFVIRKIFFLQRCSQEWREMLYLLLRLLLLSKLLALLLFRFDFYLTSIWLLCSQLRPFIERTASFTECKSLSF